MLSKSFIAFIFLLASISSANAHAGVTPALGVQGQFIRNDVQRPSTSSPCGNVNIAQTLDSSTPVPAGVNGDFSTNITDFNPGADGSRSIKEVQVDASGTGKNFVPAKMVVNGNPNPTTVATEQLSVQLPAGIKCAGGAGNNLCLASFTTTAGFGNCVVVSQGAGNDDKKKGDKKNVKQANKGASDTPAATDGNNRKRSWSSRQMGNFA
ncbi:hypothetical protein BGY98DRAFT_1023564 [Russula aff. rugulosa BPL654]|nr:hypothetical protein BGY98DRAFT_1023564 [Russula aff. rugulosa BPL654]